MPDKIFIDTNLWLYLFTSSSDNNDQRKKEITQDLIKDGNEIFISLLVLNEFSNVSLKKYAVEPDKIYNSIKQIVNVSKIYYPTTDDYKLILNYVKRLKYGFYDSCIITSALRSGCTVLYTEDLQNSQTVDNTLTIINPFISNLL